MHAVGWPSCKTSRTSAPHIRMTPNQCFAISPNSPVCCFIQVSMEGSRLSEAGSRKSWLIGFWICPTFQMSHGRSGRGSCPVRDVTDPGVGSVGLLGISPGKCLLPSPERHLEELAPSLAVLRSLADFEPLV